MSPPGLTATTEPPGEHITGERMPDLSTASGQERYLVRELGVTYPQAKALMAAYVRESSNARRLGNDTGRSDADFLSWLMRQAPVHRNRPVKKWDWRTK